MPNQSLTDVLNTTTKFMDTSFELPVEAEFLLADYDPEVFKIVKTTVKHTITQKYINGNKLVLEGFFKIAVYYQPPQGEKLTVVSKKIPFQNQLDVQQNIKPPYFINVEGILEYTNTRAVNSSRIDSRGVYSFSVTARSHGKTEITTAINSKTACFESDELIHFHLCGNGIRQFSVEEEMDIPENVEKIINISAYNNKSSTAVYENKVNVKGTVEADIVYTVDSDSELHHKTKTLSYNQVVDIDGAKENNTALSDFSLVSFTITKNPDTKKSNFILSACLDVKLFEKTSIIVVDDAFSKTYEYKKENQSVYYDENLISVNRNLSLSLEDEIGDGFSYIYDFMEITNPKVAFINDKNVLQSKISFSAILKNAQGEYECFSKSGEVNFDIDEEIKQENEYLFTSELSSRSVNIENDKLTARIAINVSGLVIKRKEITLVKSFEENTDKPFLRDEDALILYYANKGEKVFDIAKKYKTDISGIISENKLEEKILSENKMLLIPAFGM